MISQETKDQIDKESRTYLNEGNRKTYVIAATKYAEYKAQLEEKKDKLFDDLLAENVKILEDVNYYKAISDRATKYAEKLEEKDKEIEMLRQQAVFSEEIERQLQVRIAQDLEKIESKDREIEKLKQDIEAHKHRGDKGFEAARFYQEQLAQLKEIASGMKEAMEYVDKNTSMGGWAVLKEALTAYTEWCKQNLK